MNKIFAVCLATAMVGTLMIGCDLFGPAGTTTTNPPEIKKINMADTLELGESYPVTGEVTADEEITDYSYEILNSSGAVATGITVTGPNIKGDDKYTFTAQELKITVGSSVAAGTYSLKISVTAGEKGSAERSFYVKGSTVIIPEGTPIETATFKAGSNGNTEYGSSIDLDQGVAWSSATAKQNVSKIDLCYAHTGSGDDKIGTAAWAKASGFSFASTFTTAIKFYPITMTKAEFDAITTKEDLPAFDASKATAISYVAAEGDVFIAKTTEDAIALIRIDAQIAGASGYITIKLAK